MDMTAREFIANAASKLDLDGASHDAARVAQHAGTSAMRLGRTTMRDVRSLARHHPQWAAAIGGGVAVLSVVGIISFVAWLRE